MTIKTLEAWIEENACTTENGKAYCILADDLRAAIQSGELPVYDPETQVVMPREPTLEMQVAFAEAWYSKRRCFDDCEMEDCYRAMLQVAPEANQGVANEPGTHVVIERSLLEMLLEEFCKAQKKMDSVDRIYANTPIKLIHNVLAASQRKEGEA